MQPVPRTLFLALIGLLAAAAFGFLLKLMDDMSQSMSYMTHDIASIAVDIRGMGEDMHRMGQDITGLAQQVNGIRGSVDVMASDMRGMRASVDRMTGVIHSGGKQIQELNPMGVMEQIMPPGR
jgi:uncharacterized protein YoxC